jgi:hypothetical protein
VGRFQRYGVRSGAITIACARWRVDVRPDEAHPEFETIRARANILCFRWVGDGGFGDEALDAFNRELRESKNRSGEGGSPPPTSPAAACCASP